MSKPHVLQIPSHMTYVQALSDAHHPSVLTGPALRVADLFAEPRWDFEIVHLHSLELVTLDDLIRLRKRSAEEGISMVATIHDLVPNIEASIGDFVTKVAYVSSVADHVFTLSTQAAGQIAALAPQAKPAEITPHGAAIAIDSIPSTPVAGDGGLAVFGAFRPYRELGVLVEAWKRLGEARPRLRVLLRSITQADLERDGDLLDLLKGVAREDSRLSLTVMRTMVDDAVLVDWLRGTSVLVLPYSHITHSGQLELARDIGLPVIAPDVPSLHGQLANGPRPSLPVAWFRQESLTVDHFSACLLNACGQAEDTAHSNAALISGEDQDSVRTARRAERADITARHAEVYASLPTKTGERVGSR